MKNISFFRRLSSSLFQNKALIRTTGHGLIDKYPKHIFLSMCALLLCSAAIALTLLRQPETPSTGAKNFRGSQGIDLSGAAGTASAFSQVVQMQAELNALLSADKITPGDSIRVKEMIIQIRKIQSSIIDHEKNKP